MQKELEAGNKVAGAKQVRRALNDGRAARIFWAQDADPRVTEPLVRLAREQGVPAEQAASMKELGRACGISVGCAVAALLH